MNERCTEDKRINLESYQIAAVKCRNCGKLHDATSDTYFSVQGNIMRGAAGGLVGRQDWDTLGVPVNIFCTEVCLTSFLAKS
ncbi:hypothetical protein D3C74_49310 [compost metagenome]